MNLYTRKYTCRGRTRKMCKSAKKKCTYASGTKLKFCRKKHNTKRFIKK